MEKGGDAMLFTSGPDRAFERLMQEKPSFDHYDSGGADAPEDCGTCRFYRVHLVSFPFHAPPISTIRPYFLSVSLVF